VTPRLRRSALVAGATAAIVISANASEGAYFSQSWGWVALAFLVPTTIILIVDRVNRPGRLRTAFAALMAALTVWIGVSAFWSISSSASLRELERTLVYVSLAFAVALALRRGDERPLFAGLFAGIAGAVIYGLVTRLYPDRFGFERDPFNAYRLAEPLGYWNSFGLLATMGLICALGVVAHARHARAAVAAGAVVPLLSVALYFTFSRGSWVALVFGLVAALVLDPRRVQLLWSVAVVAPASVVAVAIASRQDALTTEGARLVDATSQGHRLAWTLCGVAAVSAALGWLAHWTRRRFALGGRTRRVVDVALAAVAIGIVAGAVIMAGGPASAASELRERFEADPTTDGGRDLNDRLFSASGNGRAESIGVAWDVGSEHPLAGSGAGTFEYVWYERRPSEMVIRDAHSLYAEAFGELGVLGLVLLGAVLLVPCLAGMKARRSRLVAPAMGMYLAWVAAAGLDWHWEMVGVTLTAFLAGCVGLLASDRHRLQHQLGDRTRLVLVSVATAASAFAVWSLVGNQALFAARAAADAHDWEAASDHARRAEVLLRWSHEPDLVLGDAAAAQGDRTSAARYFRHAVRKDSRNWVAWVKLAQAASGSERRAAYARAGQLNPREAEHLVR
jgi:O-Antigen ligase